MSRLSLLSLRKRVQRASRVSLSSESSVFLINLSGGISSQSHKVKNVSRSGVCSFSTREIVEALIPVMLAISLNDLLSLCDEQDWQMFDGRSNLACRKFLYHL